MPGISKADQKSRDDSIVDHIRRTASPKSGEWESTPESRRAVPHLGELKDDSTHKRLNSLVRSGRLEKVRPGVFRIPGHTAAAGSVRPYKIDTLNTQMRSCSVCSEDAAFYIGRPDVRAAIRAGQQMCWHCSGQHSKDYGVPTALRRATVSVR